MKISISLPTFTVQIKNNHRSHSFINKNLVTFQYINKNYKQSEKRKNIHQNKEWQMTREYRQIRYKKYNKKKVNKIHNIQQKILN